MAYQVKDNINTCDSYSLLTDRYALACILLILIICVWRLLFIKISGFDLSPDEAYYWDWSRHLAWGYYSKPPLIAWIIALSCKIFGTSTLTVRLPAALLSSLALLWLFLITRDMFDAKAGLYAVLFSVLAPGSCVLGLIMTIDAPLIFFWSGALYFLWKAVNSDSLYLWLITAVFAAFGFLAKQTMIAFLPLIFVYLYFHKRALLKRPGPYLVVLIVLLSIVPTLVWNANHAWITFKHTAHHFEEGGKHLHLDIKTIFEFLGSQLIVFSPITWFILILLLVKGMKSFIKDSRLAFLVTFSLFPLIPVFLLSFKQRVNANWPAPFYISAMVLVGAYAAKAVFFNSNEETRGEWLHRLVKPALIVGLILVVLVYSLPWSVSVLGIKGSKYDPTIRIRGWREFAREVHQVQSSISRQGHSKMFLCTYRRQTASELAFYMPSRPHVYCWAGLKPHVWSQYELWPGPVNYVGQDALILIESDEHFPPGIKKVFKSVRSLSPIEIPLGNNRMRSFNLYLGERLIYWPKI